ncbi:MAG: hypothetical protein HS108_10705 [Planctomycetes bacterium]|jgi:hypothetical protein|nr:hypothetical protein [Planctomycetota bacterium]MCL4728805.1 hypothetical protein [Planctomycetota bacterium]
MTRTLLALLFVLAPSLAATTALRLDLETLADRSSRIVVGKAGKSEARWDAARTGIWTHCPVTVTETLKGDAANNVEVCIRGGVVGNTGQHVAGAGHLEQDKEYLLFLWKDDAGRWQLQGMVQGAFVIEERNGEKHARNSLAGLTIVDPKTLKPAGDAAAIDLTLAAAREKVKARAAGGDK